MGLLLTVLVTAAGVQDRDGARAVIDKVPPSTNLPRPRSSSARPAPQTGQPHEHPPCRFIAARDGALAEPVLARCRGYREVVSGGVVEDDSLAG
jgi:hypothetical protein